MKDSVSYFETTGGDYMLSRDLKVLGVVALATLSVPGLAQEESKPGGAVTSKEAITSKKSTASSPSLVIAEGDIPVREFLKAFADVSGSSVLIDGASKERLADSIAIVSDVEGADPKLLREILKVNGWSLVDCKNTDRVFASFQADDAKAAEKAAATPPKPEKPKESATVYSYSGNKVRESKGNGTFSERVGPNATVTVIVGVKHLRVEDALRSLQGLVTRRDDLKFWEVAARPKMVLRGKASAVDHALNFLAAIDEPLPVAPPTSETSVRVFSLKYAKADEVAQLLSAAFQEFRMTTRGRSSRPSRSFVSDARTNRLIVRGTTAELEAVGALLQEIDIESQAKPHASVLETQVFRLKYIEAEEAAGLLAELGGSADSGLQVVSADARTNSVIVRARAQDMKEFRRILEMIDTKNSSDSEVRATGTGSRPTVRRRSRTSRSS
ncbi:MAG: secretin N-terminal domain-containing protein, partial [Planctomycetota bacterium]